MHVKAESFVFCLNSWQKIYRKISKGKVLLKNTSLLQSNTKTYTENKDYEIDYDRSMIRKISTKIKDFAENPLYNKEDFDHTQYDEYGNGDYTYYLDYTSDEISIKSYSKPSKESLKKYISNLNKKEIKVLVYGDSISTGAEASNPKNEYYNLFTNQIEKECKVLVKVVNLSKGGDSTKEGLVRLDDVKRQKADIVIVAFGMNDHNKISENQRYVNPKEYKDNIMKMITEIKGYTLLLSPCIPNPKWKYSSNTMSEYRDILKEIAYKNDIAFADVYEAFRDVIDAGKSYESLLNNNINHPNDYGHYIYYSVLKELIF